MAVVIPADLARRPQKRASQPFHYCSSPQSNTLLFCPNVDDVYMAASRWSQWRKDQWGLEDDRRRSHRDRRPRHERPLSPEPHRRDGGGSRFKSKEPGSDWAKPLSANPRRRSRSPPSHESIRPRTARKEEPREREQGTRGIEREESGKRRRERERYAAKAHIDRAFSPPHERRYRHGDYEQDPDRGLRHARPLSPRHHHPRSPRSPRGDHYSSREYPPPYTDRFRDDYEPRGRRGRSRSPVVIDSYRGHSSRQRSLSRDRYHGHYDDPYLSHRRADRSPSSRARPPARHQRLSKPDDPENPSKSSRRSEKQKQRTLRHLRARTKANDFLRRLSVSPSDDRSEDRMQQGTRPIQSILDEPPRQASRPASPPRPIPSFDDSRSGADTHMREHFPMHGMKVNDFSSGHRRGPPQIDTRQTYAASPQYMTPTSSVHGSPHSVSPYSQGRGGWGGQHYAAHHRFVPSLSQAALF